jgi:hypothetical protein
LIGVLVSLTAFGTGYLYLITVESLQIKYAILSYIGVGVSVGGCYSIVFFDSKK